MLRRFFCCFNSKSNHNNKCLDLEEISVREEIPLNFASLYDSNDWTHKPIEWKDCAPFVPPIDRGVVIKVYDGDTITIASKLPYPNSPLYRFSVRLNGIDCPEIKAKNEYEKDCAHLAKKEVYDLVFNKIVILKNVQTEKYGRVLADVYVGELHLNDHLLKKRLAVAYDGGTKNCPTNWMDYYYTGTKN